VKEGRCGAEKGEETAPPEAQGKLNIPRTSSGGGVSMDEWKWIR